MGSISFIQNGLLRFGSEGEDKALCVHILKKRKIHGFSFLEH